jgi:putative copper export protein
MPAMNPIVTVLRLVHILSGVYWAGTMFFFVTFLEPSLRSLGPDGGKVMVRFFERGYLKLLPIVAVLTMLSGLWLIWILSSGFSAEYMGSTIGMALSTGGTLAIIAFIVGMTVMRPAAAHIWVLARRVAEEKDDAARNGLMAEMGRLRSRSVLGARIVFALLIGAVGLMAIARYI